MNHQSAIFQFLPEVSSPYKGHPLFPNHPIALYHPTLLYFIIWGAAGIQQVLTKNLLNETHGRS
jgi:hypothetical protein